MRIILDQCRLERVIVTIGTQTILTVIRRIGMIRQTHDTNSTKMMIENMIESSLSKLKIPGPLTLMILGRSSR